MPLYATWLLSLGIAGFAFMGIPQGRRKVRALALCAVIGMGIVATSCAGVSSATKATPVAAPTPTPVTYAVTINGSSGSSQFSTSVNVIVQ
jgi:hypothetical protein